jgi:prolipoprotein diacylglyceryltransferase
MVIVPGTVTVTAAATATALAIQQVTATGTAQSVAACTPVVVVAYNLGRAGAFTPGRELAGAVAGGSSGATAWNVTPSAKGTA